MFELETFKSFGSVQAKPPTLTVGTAVYEGWTALRVTASIERAAGAFTLEVTERGGLTGFGRELRQGQRAVVSLAGQVVITGWIDAISRDLQAGAHTVQASGRDATADLVDCAAKVEEYKGQTLLAIALDQVAAFGPPTIPVALTEGMDAGAPFARVRVEPGQSVFEFLERLARHRGCLLMPDGRGGLLIGRAGRIQAAADIVQGQNLLGIRVTDDGRERFSEYEVRGQAAGSDRRHGAAAAHLKGLASDPEVARTRRKIIQAEDGEVDLDTRALWEQRVAYGRSLSARARVQGWEAKTGRLWQPGELVQVQAPAVEVDDLLLIVDCTYTLDGQGTVTEIGLTRPAAYDPAPATREKPDAVDAGWWK